MYAGGSDQIPTTLECIYVGHSGERLVLKSKSVSSLMIQIGDDVNHQKTNEGSNYERKCALKDLGEAFEIEGVSLDTPAVSVRVHVIAEWTRSLIVAFVFITSLLVLAACAVFGYYQNDYTFLQVAWAIIAVPFGAILHHYFSPRNRI